jgi:hypothetical protein
MVTISHHDNLIKVPGKRGRDVKSAMIIPQIPQTSGVSGISWFYIQACKLLT